MLAILDLDDTLIETSKCLTPRALEKAHMAMGLDASFEELLTINDSALSSKESIKVFWERHSTDQNILDKGMGSLENFSIGTLSIELVPGAEALLSSSHPLALVTAGRESLQLQKMEKAGIQQGRFSRLIVVEGSSKKSAYQTLIEELQLDPRSVIVCGDRIPIDLSPAKELGCTTVHFENGRGKMHKQPQKDVDFSIRELNELTRIFQKK